MPASAALAFARPASDDSAPATSSYRSSRRAAIRCTAPMNAPCPPPTMPNRNLRVIECSSMMRADALQTQHPPDLRRIDAAASEVVEGLLRHANDVPPDEFRPFARAVFRVLQRALPF